MSKIQTKFIEDGAVTNAKVATGVDASKIADGSISNAEFQRLDGVTSSIQTQLNGKQATITGAATTITSADLTASRALTSNSSGKVAVSAVTDTELGYVSGVTSAIQTQFTGKIDKSTLSAKGSIISATAASTPAEVAVGANGTFLKADSTQSAGLIFASATGVAAVTSKTSAYTANASTDDIIFCSGSAFTVTLPTPSGNAGKQFRIQKTDSSFTNVITISGTGLSTTLNTLNEHVLVVSDGTNWIVLNRSYPQNTNTYTPAWTSTGTQPAIGNGTLTGYWQRVGDHIEVSIVLLGGSTTSAGTGNYSFGLPSGLTIDTAKLDANANYIIDDSTSNFFDASASVGYSFLVTYDTTTAVTAFSINAANADARVGSRISATFPAAITTSDRVHLGFSVPITGWN